MKRFLLRLCAVSFVIVAVTISTSAFAAPILISENPWGSNHDIYNMTDVFGSGNFIHYNSFAGSNPSGIFTPSNAFVMLEGGDGTQSAWSSYLAANSSTILNWVSSGGALLLMSAGWYGGSDTLGPGTLNQDNFDPTGTLTAAGQAAFTYFATPTTQSGNYLAHNSITGVGLTDFMLSSSGKSIVAGTGYGNGYIMYSGLTDSQWHSAGNSLVDNIIAYTASQAAPVPEPSTFLLLGAGLVGISFLRRRSKA